MSGAASRSLQASYYVWFFLKMPTYCIGAHLLERSINNGGSGLSEAPLLKG